MIFNNPGALLLLLLLPLLIFFHMIQKRRKNIEVSSIFLWTRLFNDQRRTVYFRNFIWNLLLFLQLIILALIILAFADPRGFFKQNLSRGNTIFILDISASMKTEEGTNTRFDLAKSELLEELRKLRVQDKAMLLTSGAFPRVESELGSDKGPLRFSLLNLQPLDEPGNVLESISLASAFVESQTQDRILFFTDGAFEFPEELQYIPNLEIRSVGSETENFGITAFEVRNVYGSIDEYQIFISVKNFGNEERANNLLVSIDNRQIYNEPLILQSGGRANIIVPFQGILSGKAKAELEFSDSFSEDDKAYAVLTSREDLNVLLFTPGNRFLEAALQLHPNINVQLARNDVIPPNTDIVILDRYRLFSYPDGNYLFIGDEPGGDITLSVGNSVSQPGGIIWDPEDPLLDSVDLSSVYIDSTYVIDEFRDLDSFLFTPAGPIGARYESDGKKCLYFSFDFLMSDMPFRTAFPVLISNSIHYLAPDDFFSLTMQTKTGTPIRIGVPGSDGVVTVRSPKGLTETILSREGEVMVSDVSENGFYELSYTGLSGEMEVQYFAANLFNMKESDIAFRAAEKTLADYDDKPIEGEPVDFWKLLLFAGLILLVLEWLLQVKKWQRVS